MAEDRRRAEAEGEPLLFAEFPPADRGQWLAAVERSLKRAVSEEELRTVLPEGIALEAIYFPEDMEGLVHSRSRPGEVPFVRGGVAPEELGREQRITPEIEVSSPEEAGERLAEEAAGGATAAVVKAAAAAGGAGAPARGVRVGSTPDLDPLLAPVDPGAFPLFLQARNGWSTLLQGYARAAQARGVAPDRLSGAVAADPLGDLARYGFLDRSLEEAFGEVGEMTAWAAREAPALGTLWIHGERFHEAGGHAVQELGFTLAAAVESLRFLSARGLPPAHAAPHVRFGYGVGPRILVEVAKLRAARMLWNRALEACGVPPAGRRPWIHACTGRYHMTRYHAPLNVLRATVEAFAALSAGADSLCVLPHDLLLGEPDRHARRLARNIPLILREEALLARVADPLGGAWVVERLTAELARSAWALFQAVETRGGMARALEEGFPQAEIAAAERARAAAFRRGEAVKVGVNRFPDPSEFGLPERVEGEPGPPEGMRRVEPLRPRRLAAVLEALRARVEADRAAGLDRRVLVVPMGPPAACRRGLDFTAAFFQAGGFETTRLEEAPEGPGEAARRAREYGAPVAVFVPRDGEDPSALRAWVEALASEGRRPVSAIAARPPGEGAPEANPRGVEVCFVYEGADMIQTLEHVLQRMEEAS